MLPHFHYPGLARRRGWQGTVTLGLRIEWDGHLEDIRVLETSGHRVLDRAALRTLRKVEKLSDVSNVLHSAGLNLVLPVEFQLQRR